MKIARKLLACVALAATLGAGLGTAGTIVGGTVAYAGSKTPGPPPSTN